MRVILVVGFGFWIELDDLDSAPVSSVFTPTFRVILAGSLVDPGSGIEDLTVAAGMSVGRVTKLMALCRCSLLYQETKCWTQVRAWSMDW